MPMLSTKSCFSMTRKATAFLSLGLILTLSVAILSFGTDARAVEEESATASLSYAKALSKAFRQTSQTVLPSVVSIQSTPIVQRSVQPPNGVPDGFPEGFFEDFLQRPEFRRYFRPQSIEPSAPGAGLGSGVILDESGLILTNNHVVQGSGKVIVKLADGREFQAVDVRKDPNTDLAVVRIEKASGLVAAKLGDSERVEIGDWVLALGQPFGLEGTVTAGIVSAKGRGIGIATSENFIQTDAAINPGNSGGPLVNLDGEVIGINTAISSNSGGNQGIGFAVPVNLARWVSEQLIASGEVQRSFLGVRIQPVTHDLAQRFGVESNRGALVTSVLDDSPAAKAGVERGDIIVMFGDRTVSSPHELQVVVQQVKPGSKQPVKVLRDGKEEVLFAVCGTLPNDLGSNKSSVEEHPGQELGFEIGDLDDDVAGRLGVANDEGVVITRVKRGSVAAAAGIATGDVISEVNRTAVSSVSEFRSAIKKSDADGTLLLVISPRGSRYVVLQPE
jgi:serine protease Do